MRSKLILGALLALALSVAGVSLAFAGGGGSSDDGTHVLRLTSKTVQAWPPESSSPTAVPKLGDRQTFSDDVSGDATGTLEGGCEVTRLSLPTSVTFHCAVTLDLSGGQITVQGVARFTGATDPAPFTLAVTGGTDRYGDAEGEAEVDISADGLTSKITVTLAD